MKGSKLRNNFLKIKYLANSNEKDIVNNKTFWKTIKPSLFNIFFADLCFIQSDTDIANVADDNTPYLSAKNQKDVIESLERDLVSLFRRLENSLLKGNADKCHFLVSISQEDSLNVNNFKIKNSGSEKLLGVIFDSRLRFDQYITDLRSRSNRKLHALARVTPFMNL